MPKTLFFLFVAAAAAQSPMPPAAKGKVDFQKQIQPLLAEKCLSCHGLEVQQAGLRLDTRQPALRGGDYGPVVLPGNSAGDGGHGGQQSDRNSCTAEHVLSSGNPSGVRQGRTSRLCSG